MQQVHDFNPGIGSNGLFWIMQIPDEAVKVTGDTLTISLTNASLVDQFQFPGGAGNNLGNAGVPTTVSFDITFTKSGSPRHVQPTSADPLSPFHWAGEMWEATNSGTFSVAHNDGSGFSASGTFSSMGNFGQMGTERNGSFLGQDQSMDAMGPMFLNPLAQEQASGSPDQWSKTTPQLADSAKFKGKVPVKSLIH